MQVIVGDFMAMVHLKSIRALRRLADANARVRYRIKQGTGGKTLTFVGFASTGGYTDAGNVAYSSIMFDAVWTQSGWKIDLIGGGWG